MAMFFYDGFECYTVLYRSEKYVQNTYKTGIKKRKLHAQNLEWKKLHTGFISEEGQQMQYTWVVQQTTGTMNLEHFLIKLTEDGELKKNG